MINYNASDRSFHLTNGRISYLLTIMQNGQIGHLYFRNAIRSIGNFLHMNEMAHRPMTAYPSPDDHLFSLEHQRQEYPSGGGAQAYKAFGSALMHYGLVISDSSTGERREGQEPTYDFDSQLFVIEAE